jgi:LacI family transcriptional regulator
MDLNWPYKRHYETFAGIRDFAKKHANWTIDPGNFPHYEIAHGKRYDGIVGRISKDCLLAARKAGIPVVNVWIDSPVAVKVTGVYMDSHAAGRLAAEHLFLRGFRRLAHFGFRGSADTKRHLEGVREVARKYGYPCASHATFSAFADKADNWARFVEYVKRTQDGWEAPMGIVFPYDELGHAVSTICLAEGWKIPEELAMIGCCNDQIICNVSDPSLSSIDVAAWKCGHEAARLLDDLMRGKTPPASPILIPPKELVVRKSTDFHAVGDPRVARALSYMAEQSTAHLSVPKIARFVGIGRQTLERGFREQLGRTVNEELIRLRISKLKRLLVESDESVKELSGKVGFGTTANMFPMFKRHTGMTPKEYREKHSSSPEL